VVATAPTASEPFQYTCETFHGQSFLSHGLHSSALLPNLSYHESSVPTARRIVRLENAAFNRGGRRFYYDAPTLRR